MLLDLIELLPDYTYVKWKPVMDYGDGVVEGLGILSKYEFAEEPQFIHLDASSDEDANKRGLI